MGTPGYVYVLINPSMPNLVKVGRTTRDPSDRVSELSSVTGVATPFALVYKEYFGDCGAAETYVHTMLERNGVRVSSNREFFQGEVSDIIRIVIGTPGKASPTGYSPDDDDDLLSHTSDELDDITLSSYKPKSADEEIREEADQYYYGFGNTIQDYSEAMKLYKQAAKLGSSESYYMIGQMYMYGESVREDFSKALEYFKEAARRGVFIAYAPMASIFRDTSHPENEFKAWSKFFGELQKNNGVDFECDDYGGLCSSFLYRRVSQGGFLSSMKVKLLPEEEAFIPTIKSIKKRIVTALETQYKMSVEHRGETDSLSKKYKTALLWVQDL